jgi:hypothetical protein
MNLGDIDKLRLILGFRISVVYIPVMLRIIFIK